MAKASSLEITAIGQRAVSMFGTNVDLTYGQVKAIAKDLDGTIPSFLWTTYKTGKGRFTVPTDTKDLLTPAGYRAKEVHRSGTPAGNLEALQLGNTPSPVQTTGRQVGQIGADQAISFIPVADKNFVPWGNYADVLTILKANIFYPIFITGLSGNGKTTSVIEAAAEAGRELIRVNFTMETDEDDLLGGFRLIDGETVWQDGPVITAMKRGAVLLLDEVSLASHKVMCLQPVLEGKGIYLKKINQMILPTKGFTVVATDNTKGRGSEDGRFVGTNVLNEAFLDRFAATYNQPYAGTDIEKKIVKKMAISLGIDKEHNDFLTRMVTWADITRKTFYEGGIDDIISTRRLLDATKALAIFGDTEKAINLVTERFDDNTRDAFRTVWASLTPKPEIEDTSMAPAQEAAPQMAEEEDQCPF